MATALRISLEEYLSTHYEPECEFINGELFPKPTGTLEHMRMERTLIRLLEPFELAGFGSVVHELSMRNGENVRIPDLVFVTTEARFELGILLDPPLLCVEILSPSQRPSELFAKCETYHVWGVPYGWVLDPIAKLAWEYHKGAPLRLLALHESLQAGEIAVSLRDLFQ